MGSGGMVGWMKPPAGRYPKFFLGFTQEESCGNAYPAGWDKMMLDILDRITAGGGQEEDLETLSDLAGTIKATALCGWAIPRPTRCSPLCAIFRDEYEAHVRKSAARRTPAFPSSSYVQPGSAKRCGQCFKACPAGAVAWEEAGGIIGPGEVRQVKNCIMACKFNAIE